ncbi:fumarylacetoacetate (FAA) hydrolase [Perkinsela sp. CCAP 1560/4]|nr:fumarylacetoacetate (FAA) hydrolase [Perkinsela sp. CCAP 1560/4]|eukprot:KNH05434.1 fumarylacetoacetate (FAA) hydrolase [Perkinsela sp. CCAP 1560/4]
MPTTDLGARIPPREFMSFTETHISEYLRHLQLTAGASRKHERSSLPSIKFAEKSGQLGTGQAEETSPAQKRKPETLMTLQEIMPGVLEGLETSYKFQNRVIEMMKTKGVEVVAWRVAGTNRMFLRQWGIKSPIVAPVFSTMRYNDEEEISINKHKIMHLEVNFAFRLGQDMPLHEIAPPTTEKSTALSEDEKPMEVPVERILSYVDAFYPVMDFTGSRYPARAPHSSALVADLIGSTAISIGEAVPVEKWKDYSMTEYPCVLFLGDDPVATGKGEVVIENPLRSLPYVAKNFYVSRGEKVLEKGTVILTGPCTTAMAIKKGKYTAHFGPLGKVSAHVID